jgi:hypothetical protein
LGLQSQLKFKHTVLLQALSIRARDGQASQPQKNAATAPTKAPVQAAASDMVNEWLKKKAQAQREAAKDFLRTTATTTQTSEASKAVAGAQNGARAVVGGAKQPQGGAVEVPAPLPSAPVMVHTVAGGVIRGKIYKGKRSGLV